jgi:hypothetical protein
MSPFLAHRVISLQSSALVAFGREADIKRQAELAGSVANDPTAKNPKSLGLRFLLQPQQVLAWLHPLTRRLLPRFSCFEKLVQGLDLAMPVLPGCCPFDPRPSPSKRIRKFLYLKSDA